MCKEAAIQMFASSKCFSRSCCAYSKQKKPMGAAQQVRDIVRKAGGIQLKVIQAYNVVTSKRQDGVKVHIGQHFLLTSYFEHLQKTDPDGIFILETQHSAWLSEWPQF
jgi:3'-phosphoadenosine 5'-phosphosulfate (PAPS) 3'-phosphatase